ncbi:hypothetical protein HC031_14020 [Planosporangium thailandense]|uniref:DUF4332 domain-containing protein n=1 Tax=Planosporangium thailandense TaxID=765197 RepID=A0ABX0Y012_9ACTN|nr:hypothetical protein [Planosporangium thailandense]
MGEVIDDLLKDPKTPKLVAAFYHPANGFAGDTFLALAPNEPNVITIPDLLAVTLLEVRFWPTAVRTILPGGELDDKIQQHLAAIPLGVPLWEATDVHLAWAESLWKLLNTKQVPGVGKSIAGKLLARKRPDLIPIVDNVIAKKLNCASMTYWTTYREVLTCEERRQRLSALRPGTSTVRVLDTVMWMHWSNGKQAKNIRDHLG